MRRTSDWVTEYGGVPDIFIEDPAADHGGFQQSPAHIRSALQTFALTFALRTASLTNSRWDVRRDHCNFEIPNASTPNVGLVNGEVWLIAGTNAGARLYRSSDGTNATSPEQLPGLTGALSGSGYGPGACPARTAKAIRCCMCSAGSARRQSLRYIPAHARANRLPVELLAVRSSREPRKINNFWECLISPPRWTAGSGSLTLCTPQSNSRTAISADGGLTFTPEFRNTFGDLAIPNPRPTDINVDPPFSG